MSILLKPGLTAPKTMSGIRQDLYVRGIYWVLREQAGGGGWPPREVSRVKGWMMVRMLATIHEMPPAAVAADLIAHYDAQQDDKQWP